MDKKKYLENRKKLQQDKFPERKICYDCRKPKTSCQCNHLRPFDTNTRFIILMHMKEAKKERVGTGRLSHLILKNSKIITGVDFSNDKKVNEILKDPSCFPVILYPGDNSFNISKNRVIDLVPKNRKLLVFIIDGTWFFAKKMLRVSRNLQNIPRISFETKKKSEFKIKQQPAEICLSTIEALYELIDELKKQNFEKQNLEHLNLPDTLNRLVKFQMDCASDSAVRGYRKRKFKDVAKRTPSKRRI